jgi:prepilin-type N-terminal cleavage/methylation domain-containing protein
MKNPLPLLKSNRVFRKASLGFSLVEILIVLLIISILMTAGVMGLKNLSAGKGTSSAIATCESLFNEARTIAISKRCKSRLMIDVNDIDSDDYLRRVVIAHQKINDDGTIDPNAWILSSRAYTLPAATFFSREHSKLVDDSKIPEANMSGENFTARYAGNYVFYEFNAEGIPALTPTGESFIGASFIIGGGIRPKGQEPRLIKDAEKDLAGFVIWRNGRTSTYRNPEHMEIDTSQKNF